MAASAADRAVCDAQRREPVRHHNFRAGYRAATITFGAAGLALAAGISAVIAGRGLVVVILLAVFAISRAAISWSDGRSWRKVDAHREGAFPPGLCRIRICDGRWVGPRGCPLQLGQMARAGRSPQLWATLWLLAGFVRLCQSRWCSGWFGAIERAASICSRLLVRRVRASACARASASTLAHITGTDVTIDGVPDR